MKYYYSRLRVGLQDNTNDNIIILLLSVPPRGTWTSHSLDFYGGGHSWRLPSIAPLHEPQQVSWECSKAEMPQLWRTFLGTLLSLCNTFNSKVSEIPGVKSPACLGLNAGQAKSFILPEVS